MGIPGPAPVSEHPAAKFAQWLLPAREPRAWPAARGSPVLHVHVPSLQPLLFFWAMIVSCTARVVSEQPEVVLGLVRSPRQEPAVHVPGLASRSPAATALWLPAGPPHRFSTARSLLSSLVSSQTPTLRFRPLVIPSTGPLSVGAYPQPHLPINGQGNLPGVSAAGDRVRTC